MSPIDGYMLFRQKDGKTAIVLVAEDDEELFYVVSKLSKTRNKSLKALAQRFIEEFFTNTNKME